MQLAHTVTAIVNAYLVGKFSFQFLDLHNIVQELADIINLLTVHTNVIPLLQDMGMVLFYEGYATGRGAYHVVIVLKLFLHPEGQASRLILEAGVRHGLSATGLVHRIIDIHTHMPQQFIRGDTHFGVHRVNVTWDK